MATLAYISAASIIGGVLSICVAAAVSFAARAHWVSALISFAIGALLGAAFLDVLPHVFGNAEDLEAVAATVLAGILGFFVLEKLVLWRHYHAEDVAPPHPDAHDHGRSGMLILVGDSFHNFVDGILIAAAFMESTALGLVTATAVIAHEIPQEVGDFLILLHSGYSKARAFAFNLLSSLAMVVGALGAYFALHALEGWVNTLLALAGASMIYVAVADLIPGLHKRTELRATAQQVLLIGLGVMTVWLIGRLAHG
ncbi:MAG TPA: ZIP family metal transporter, partial [Burkholderiales bacterium]|nr:ZIP family metal transporter [Burkholderiales bacterium]